MAVYLSYLAGAGAQFFDNSGVPLTGGLLYTYAAGTTTPQATFTTNAGNVANTNPIVLNSAGRLANEIWLTENVNYKFVLQTSAAVLIGTYDNIPGINDPTAVTTNILAQLANTSDVAKGDALVGFKQANPFDTTTVLTGAVARTVHTKFTESVSLRDFGAVGDGTTNDTTAFQAAITACANNNITLFVPDGTFMYGNVTVPATKTLSIVGSSRENAVLKQISASTNATAGITATGDFFASNVCFNQNWTQASPAGYADDVSQTTWGGYFIASITTTGTVSIDNCKFALPCRGISVVNANYVDFFNNTSNALLSPGQTIIACSNCQQVSMNDNTLIAPRWTDPATGNKNGISALYNFNTTNLEICNNTMVGHQLVARGSVGTFVGSISTTTLTVTSLSAGVAIFPGGVISGNNIFADNAIISQLSGTTGGAGTYLLQFSNGSIASTTMNINLARAVVSNNIIDTPVADTAFYGWKYLTMTGNIIRQSGDMGIAVDGSQYVTITGNVIDGVLAGGIHVGSAYGVTITGNSVKDYAQANNGPYAFIAVYGRYASSSPSLAGIAIDFASGNTTSFWSTITGNTLTFENFPPATDARPTGSNVVAAIVGGIRIQTSSNPAAQSTAAVTGNYVESLYSTLPQNFVQVPSNRFYLAASSSTTGTPIGGEVFTNGANSFVLIDSYGDGALCFIKKLVGTIPVSTTFTGALSGATLTSNSLPQLTFLQITGAGNFDWTTTYANQNIGV